MADLKTKAPLPETAAPNPPADRASTPGQLDLPLPPTAPRRPVLVAPEIKFEKLADTFRELLPLMKENWLENGIDHGLGFSPDFSRYLSLDLSGHLLVCTAREEGVIIGFMFVVVNEHIDHTGFLWALITWYYVHPAYRGAGAGSKLLDFIETFLKERNVKVIEASEKVLKKHGLFAKRGYVETDVVYRKVF